MLSFFVVLTVLFFFLAKEKGSLSLSFIAGISCGLAVLVKQTAGFIVIAILVFQLWHHRSNILKINKIPQIIFDKYLLIFGIGVAITTLHWFYIVTKVYGEPLYTPPIPKIVFQQVWWFNLLSKRPVFLYLVTIPYLVPLFALMYFSIIIGPFIKGFINERKTFLIIWALTFLVILIWRTTKENRYMLPAYPAIAMLSADLLVRIEAFIDNRLKKPYGLIVIIAALIACAFWSVPIGINHALANFPLILKPF